MRNRERPMPNLLKVDNIMDDRISELPDGIRESILSNLTFSEAVATCVLSRRWGTTWQFLKVYNLDASNVLLEIKRIRRTLNFCEYGTGQWFKDSLAQKQDWYSAIACRGLSSIKSPTMECMRLCFGLNSRFKDRITGCIQSALDKKTQCLRLNLTPLYPIPDPPPDDFLDAYVITMDLLAHTNTKLLTCISLEYVQVSDEVFQHLLSNCPALQSVCIHASNLLTNVSVTAPSLQHLKISACLLLECIHVSAPALSSFEFYGRETVIDIKNAPLLTGLGIGDTYLSLNRQLLSCSGYFSGLKSLTLKYDIWYQVLFKYYRKTYEAIPKLPNLTHLEIHGRPLGNFSLLPYMDLLESCPALSSFKMKKISTKYFRDSFGIVAKHSERERDIKAANARASPLKYMRVVEFSGFLGSTTDVEIVMFLLNLSVALDKLIIRIAQPIDNYIIIPPEKDITEADRELARDCALRIAVPAGTQLVVLL